MAAVGKSFLLATGGNDALTLKRAAIGFHTSAAAAFGITHRTVEAADGMAHIKILFFFDELL